MFLDAMTKRSRELAKIKQKKAEHVPSTPFRAEELYWKNRVDQPDKSKAFQAECQSWSDDCCCWNGQTIRRSCIPTKNLSEHGTTETTLIQFESMPGLVFLPSLFTPATQRALARTCLEDGPRQPNTTSLDPFYCMPNEGLWRFYQSDQNGTIKCKPKRPETVLKRTAVNLKPITNDNFYSERAEEREREKDLSAQQGEGQLAAELDSEEKQVSVQTVLDKLRWASIGLAYHWGTKTYVTDALPPPVPSLIEKVCRNTVASIPWPDLLPQEPNIADWQAQYAAEGGIINFYGIKDALTGHIDHSEAEASRPLVSISLGLDAIFLVGSDTRQTRPIPLLLKSGDVVIMSGPCRRVFHGVPRVFETGNINAAEDTEWIAGGFDSFLSRKRININIRQVYPSTVGVSSPEKSKVM